MDCGAGAEKIGSLLQVMCTSFGVACKKQENLQLKLTEPKAFVIISGELLPQAVRLAAAQYTNR